MPVPRHITQDISHHLDAIRVYFTAPKVTLLVRNPALDDGDFLLTEDDLDLVIRALQRLSTYEEINLNKD
jgi:hypothetical protein